MWTSHAEEKVGERRTTHAGTVEPWEPGRQARRQEGRQAGRQEGSCTAGWWVVQSHQVMAPKLQTAHLVPNTSCQLRRGPRS